jgi:uncharacterized protein (TIGR03790 family)
MTDWLKPQTKFGFLSLLTYLSLLSTIVSCGIIKFELRNHSANNSAASKSVVPTKDVSAENNSPSPEEDHVVAVNGARPLVIYNTNDPESLELANYYRQARGLKISQVCGVPLPRGTFAHKDQFIAAHRHILASCICPLIAKKIQATDCGIERVDRIAEIAPITHLVLMRGLPHRLYGTGWTLDHEGPSLDYYLGALLYRNPALVFGPLGDGRVATYSKNPLGQAVPNDPKITKTAVVGRIAGLSLASGKQMIDRGRLLEKRGFSGQALMQNSTTNRTLAVTDASQALLNATNSDATKCRSYEDWLTSWPTMQCLALYTPSGRMPGEERIVPKTGLYLGRNTNHTFQAAFNGQFSTVKNWRLTHDGSCEPLCQNMPDPTSCRSRSKDFYKVLNSDCVGLDPGFIGGQVRSYPVKYYGILPKGWSTRASSLNPITAPTLMQGDSWRDEKHTDQSYLRFGNATQSPETCAGSGAESIGCVERLSFLISTPVNLSLDPSSIPKTITLKFRVRHPAGSGQNPMFYSQLIQWRGNTRVNTSQMTHSGTIARTDWTTLTHTLTLTDSTVTHVEILFYSYVAHQMTAFFDIDGIELFDTSAARPTSLIPTETGSFSGNFDGDPDDGSWPAWIIDRMGGHGWWGSGSHHLTGGFAFSDHAALVDAMFQGLTLGESVWLGGSGASGTAYIDPVVKFGSASIVLDDVVSESSFGRLRIQSNTPWSVPKFFPADLEASFKITASYGQNENIRWILDVCKQEANNRCDALLPTWQKVAEGATPVTNHQATTISTLTSKGQNSGTFEVRLRVFGPEPLQPPIGFTGIFQYDPDPVPRLVGVPLIRKQSLPTNMSHQFRTLDPPQNDRFTRITKEGYDSLEFKVDAFKGLPQNAWRGTITTRIHGSWNTSLSSVDPLTKTVKMQLENRLVKPDVVNLQIYAGTNQLYSVNFLYLPGDVSPSDAMTTTAAVVDEHDVEEIRKLVGQSRPNGHILSIFDLNFNGAIDRQDQDLVERFAADPNHILP